MILANEVIHQALKRDIPYVLAKLDIEITPLTGNFSCAYHHRFNPKYLVLLTAICSSAASRVQLNGRATSAIPVKRSVRQGYLRSHLFFIFAMEALCSMMEEAVTSNQITGLHYTIALYADNVTLMLRATLSNIQAAMCLFNTFGAASDSGRAPWRCSFSMALPPQNSGAF